MNVNFRAWLPIVLCCVPVIAIAALVGIGIAVGGAAFSTSFGGPLGLGLIALALLACPVSMGLMMRRQRESNQNSAPASSLPLASCCLPGGEVPADQLAALRARREALERELAEMQMQSNKRSERLIDHYPEPVGSAGFRARPTSGASQSRWTNRLTWLARTLPPTWSRWCWGPMAAVYKRGMR